MGPIQIIQWNCRSIWNKLPLLNCTIFERADVLVLQETFLDPGKSLSIPGKIIYRLDRQGRPGGGLLTAVNWSFSSVRLPDFNSSFGNEFLGVRIKVGPALVNIINVYSSSGRVTEDLKCYCLNLVGSSFILGDFNLHHPLWGASNTSRFSEDFVEWLSDAPFCLINSSIPTHVAPSGLCSLLDLSLCSIDLLARSSLQVEEDPYESDHFPVFMSVDLIPPPRPPRCHFRWSRICQAVNFALQDCASLDYASFLETVQLAMETNRYYENPRQKSFAAWWNPRCSNLLHQKKFFLRQARRLASTEYWTKYRRTAAKLRQVIKEAKRLFWDSSCQNASDPNILFRVFKKFRNQSSAPSLSHFCLESNGRLDFDAKSQAEKFADGFSLHGGHDPLPLTYGGVGNIDLNQQFSLEELEEAIGRTKITSPGEDGISAKLFKGLDKHARGILLQVYNEIWASSDIPSSWTTAIILPILKPGKDNRKVSSYRPIALTPVMCKICERMVMRRLNLYLTQNRLINPNQLGFLPFRDSRVAITKLQMDFQRARENKKYIVGISLDLKSAYDSVYVDGLILKCAQLGITGRILRWIHSFLNNRSLKVSWRGEKSSSRRLGRGVPQGAVLSPVLFTIFLSDFFEAIGGRVRGLIYADDIFLYYFGDSLRECHIGLQDALRSVAVWCQQWRMILCAEKCCAINLSRRRGECDFDLFIGVQRVKWVPEIKFLGFKFARRGGLQSHVKMVRGKAFVRLNLLKSLSARRYGARTRHLLTLAGSVVRSLVDYGATILNSASETLLKKLEVLNTSVLRVALGMPKWSPNIVVRYHADCPSLHARIRALTLQFWVKQISLGSFSPLAEELGTSVQCPFVPKIDFPREIVEVFEVLGCPAEGIIPFYFSEIQVDRSILIIREGLPFQNSNLNEAMVSNYYFEFLNSLDGDFEMIGTDASKTACRTTIGGCSQDGQFGYLIHQVNSIFTAEALAIGIALDELVSYSRSIVIFSDSLSVLTALQHVSISSPTVILWLQMKLRRAASWLPRIILCWVPGHRGIPLNERADEIAKKVGELDIRLDWVSPEDVRRYLRDKAMADMRSQYKSSRYQLQLGDIPPVQVIHTWAGNRREDVLISRFITKQLITPAILRRFNLVGSDQCQVCGSVENIEHIICHCVRYERERLKCFKEGSSSLYVASYRELISCFCSSRDFRLAMLRYMRAIDRF